MNGSHSAVLPVLFLAVAITGCMAPGGPTKAASDDPTEPPAGESAQPTATAPGEPSATGQGGPVKFRVDGGPITPPIEPSVVVGVAVPAVVTEPDVRYVPPPRTDETDDLELGEIPIPLGVGSAPATGAEKTVETSTHVGSVADQSIRFERHDGITDLEAPLATFFAALSPIPPTVNPQVAYDKPAQRFVVAALERQESCPHDSSRILLAVSEGPDPNGSWTMTSIPAQLPLAHSSDDDPGLHWAAALELAINARSIHITAAMRTFGDAACDTRAAGQRVWIVDKGLGSGGLFDGGAARVSLIDPSATADPESIATP